MTGDPDNIAATRFKPMTLALAGVAVLAAGLTLIPPTYRPWNLSARWSTRALRRGATRLLARGRHLHTGSRLQGTRRTSSMECRRTRRRGPATWATSCWAGRCATDRVAGARSEPRPSPRACSFLLTNFGSWLEQAYPYGIRSPVFWIVTRPGFRSIAVRSPATSSSPAASSRHAVLSHAYFPADELRLS